MSWLWWSLLAVVSVLLVLVVVYLLQGRVAGRVAAPPGPYAVGHTSFMLEDAARPETATDGSVGPRRQLVSVWYPAMQLTATTTAVPLRRWEELLTEPQFRLVGRLLWPVARMPAHARRELPPAQGERPFPLLVYHHGLVSYPSENSLLLERLASQGYVIFSISHVNQLAALRTLGQEGSGESAEALLQRIARATSSTDKAAIGLDWYEAAVATNALVASRVQDTQLLLDQLQTAPPPRIAALMAQVDGARIGLLGHSLGAAVATEYCRISGLCAALVILDGGDFGHHQREPLSVPALRLSHEAAADLNEHQRLTARAPYHNHVFAGTRHGVLTDQAVLVPLLQWAGVFGTADPAAVHAALQTLVADFLDDTLQPPLPAVGR